MKVLIRFVLIGVLVLIITACNKKDTTPPVIKLNGQEVVTVVQNEKFNDPGATAIDNKDGNITSKIIVKGKVDTSKVGVYTLTYEVTDSSGNKATKTRTVKVIKNNKRLISGYVVDDPVKGATIEIYDLNGKLLKQQTNATDKNGKFRIYINKNTQFPILIKTYGGSENNKQFEDEMYSICYNEQCNITPLTTLAVDSFINNLKNVTKQQIDDYIYKIIGVSDWQSKDIPAIKALRQYAQSSKKSPIDIISKLSEDIKDGYIDDLSLQPIFPNGTFREDKFETFDVDTTPLLFKGNLKVINLITGEKVDIGQPINYKDFGLEIALVRDIHYKLLNGKDNDEVKVLLLPFSPYSENKIDLNSTIYHYIFMDPVLSELNNESIKELIKYLNSHYPQKLKDAQNTYKDYLNGYASIDDAMDKVNYLSLELRKNLSNIKLQSQVSIKPQKRLFKRMLRTINSTKNELSLGAINLFYKPKDKMFNIRNLMPMYVGLTSKSDYLKFIEDGGKNLFNMSTLFSSFNHNLLDENSAGAAGFAISGLLSILDKKHTGAKNDMECVDFDSNLCDDEHNVAPNYKAEYVLYDDFRLSSLQGILNDLDILQSILRLNIHFKVNKKKLETLKNMKENFKKKWERIVTIASSINNILDSIIDLSEMWNDSGLPQPSFMNKDSISYYKNLKGNIESLINKLYDTIPENLIDENFPTKKEVLTKKDILNKDNFLNILNIIFPGLGDAYTNSDLLKIIKFPTYDGKKHYKDILAAFLLGTLGDPKGSYPKFFKERVSHGNKNNPISAYINTDSLIFAWYIAINEIKAYNKYKEKVEKKYLNTLIEKEYIVNNKEKGYRNYTSSIGYTISRTILTYYKEKEKSLKLPTKEAIEKEKKLVDVIKKKLKKLRSNTEILSSISKYFTGKFKDFHFSDKAFGEFLWTNILKPIVFGQVERADDFLKKKIVESIPKLLGPGLAGTLAMAANDIGGKVVAVTAFPTVSSFKIETDDKGNIYFEKSMNITPIATEEGVLLLPGDKDNSYRLKAFLKRPTQKSNVGVAIANSQDPAWIRPYLGTIFKEPLDKVNTELDKYNDNLFVNGSIELNLCHESNNGYICNINSQLENITLTADDIDNDWFNPFDGVLREYPANRKLTYFDIVDMMIKKNKPTDMYLKGPGIYQNKVKLKYFAFDDNINPKFKFPEISTMWFVLPNNKEFDFDVDENDTHLIINFDQLNQNSYIRFFVVSTQEYENSHKFTKAYSFTTINSNNNQIITIPKEKISSLGDNITIIAVDSLFDDFAKYMKLSPINTLNYLVGDNNLKEFIDVYSNDDNKYAFLKVKHMIIRAIHKPYLYVNSHIDEENKKKIILDVIANDEDDSSVNCTIDWGDGTQTNKEIDTGDIANTKFEHIYKTSGIKKILVTVTDSTKLTDKQVEYIVIDKSDKLIEFYGNVTDENNLPIPNAKVKLEYLANGKNQEKIAITDNNGDYTIDLDKNTLSNGGKYSIIVSKDGYLPNTKQFEYSKDRESYTLNIKLKAKEDNYIVLEVEPTVHHLGDGNFAGAINSQFQRNTEGTTFEKTFYIKPEIYDKYNSAVIKFVGKGFQEYNNKLYINGKFFSYIGSSPYDGSYGYYRWNIYNIHNILKKGENTLKITSGKNYNNDYDDFEFANIIIELRN